ncbi:hypothetical protein HDU93_001597 [Gonapodya sp. JEL0774]|nr:hypothetical protein HDU93_001597 [Gonapodya sp. JEL0774]
MESQETVTKKQVTIDLNRPISPPMHHTGSLDVTSHRSPSLCISTTHPSHHHRPHHAQPPSTPSYPSDLYQNHGYNWAGARPGLGLGLGPGGARVRGRGNQGDKATSFRDLSPLVSVELANLGSCLANTSIDRTTATAAGPRGGQNTGQYDGYGGDGGRQKVVGRYAVDRGPGGSQQRHGQGRYGQCTSFQAQSHYGYGSRSASGSGQVSSYGYADELTATRPFWWRNAHPARAYPSSAKATVSTSKWHAESWTHQSSL